MAFVAIASDGTAAVYRTETEVAETVQEQPEEQSATQSTQTEEAE